MRLIFLATLFCLVAIGCRTNPRCQRETELLRAELLDLEDKYYLLKSEFEPDGGVGTVIDGSYEVIESPSFQNGAPDELPQPQKSILNDDDVFQFDVPQNETTTSINESTSNVSHSQDPTAPVSRITINRRATRGHDVDGILGDEGIDLLVQTRTANGSIILQAGELTVSIIDPAEPAEYQRIGLWKFLPEETELFFANHELGNRGILLHLPWDQSTPTNSDLTIHVRFITHDGRILKSTSKIRITPPADEYSSNDPLVTRWTNRDDRWGSSQARSDWRPKNRNDQGRQASSQRADSRRPNLDSAPTQSTNLQPQWQPIR